MSKKGDLIGLRLKLDDAITYGSQREARRLAQEGLRQAKTKKFPGETEYFKGQVEIDRKSVV